MEFKNYRKKTTTEMVEYSPEMLNIEFWSRVSISKEDKENGSPKLGDMIARNPDNHDDMWLVSKEYFEKNYQLDTNIEYRNIDLDTINSDIEYLYKKGEIDIEKISDTYHTFGELYEFRKMYNAVLFNEWAKTGKYYVHKSLRHSDGKYCFDSDGKWFIVVAQLPTGQISNHYPIEDWDLFQVPEKDYANEYDGHTSQDVLVRMEELAKVKPDADFIERMKNEYGELDFKLDKLIQFIEDNPKFNDLHYRERQLLLEQRVLMSYYRSVLNQRIQWAKGIVHCSN